jgi:hypothetical protein
MAQGTTKGVPIDIDPLLAADSDLLVPSQKAIKTYVDTGLLTKQGALTLTTTGTSGASTLLGNTLNIPQYQTVLTNPVTGTGTINEIAYFNTTGSTIASLPTATYPSLTELSYVKGVTSAIQTQINSKVTNNAWVDYSATSTIVGFTAYNVKKIQYKITAPDTMIVMFQIESTAANGSGTATSFTLPFSVTSWGTQYNTYRFQNNISTSIGMCTVVASSNVVTFYPGGAVTNWTTATTRAIQGVITLNI